MAGKYKRIYIASLSAGTISIMSLFYVLLSVGFVITSNGDVDCNDSVCVSYFNVTNPTAKSVYIYNKEDISDRLPASLSGRYELKSFEPAVIAVDPVVLRNRWHQIIYQWPDGFISSWVDVLNVCNKLGIN